jgi:hypothetical protein
VIVFRGHGTFGDLHPKPQSRLTAVLSAPEQRSASSRCQDRRASSCKLALGEGGAREKARDNAYLHRIERVGGRPFGVCPWLDVPETGAGRTVICSFMVLAYAELRIGSAMFVGASALRA